jgi:hypothetical protein
VAGIELSSQRAWLLRGGTVTYGSVPVATGKASAPTPWVCSVGGRSARGLMRRWVAGGRVAFPGFLVEQSADRRGRARTGSRGPVMWLAEGLGWAAE